MPVSRMKMRPWLVNMIENKKVTGLAWLDEEKTMFSIPWKHAARFGWDVDKDAFLFKMWAIHTGKYAEGRSPDAKTWKANFRCALNSLPDVEEVKDKSVNKGHSAVRVFRILPQKLKEKRGKAKSRKQVKSLAEESDDSDCQSPPSPPSPTSTTSPADPLRSCGPFARENVVDSTVAMDAREDALSFELHQHPSGSFQEKFQISPERSPEYQSEYDDVVEICRRLERDVQEMNFHEDKVIQYPRFSPGSQWSECSADEVEVSSRMYTTLNLGIPAASWLDGVPLEAYDVHPLDF
ncbi:uncharacterized protein LOC144213063 [Stigmatopora nigra]